MGLSRGGKIAQFARVLEGLVVARYSYMHGILTRCSIVIYAQILARQRITRRHDFQISRPSLRIVITVRATGSPSLFNCRSKRIRFGLLVHGCCDSFASRVDLTQVYTCNSCLASCLSLHMLGDSHIRSLVLECFALLIQDKCALVGLKNDAGITGVHLHHVLILLGAQLQVLD